MEKLCIQLGRKVKKYRKAKNYSTAELAAKLNVSPGLINNIENANNDVFRLELLMHLVQELDISIVDLLQIKPIDLHNINISKEQISVSLDIFDNEHLQEIKSIDKYMVLLLTSYFKTIIQCRSNDKTIQRITEQLIQELEFIQQLYSDHIAVPI